MIFSIYLFKAVKIRPKGEINTFRALINGFSCENEKVTNVSIGTIMNIFRG